MSDEGVIIEVDGRVVGVAVRVRGGFMFFSTDAELKALEATVFHRTKMIMRRVADIVHGKQRSKESAKKTSWASPTTGSRGDNVVQLRPRQWHTKPDPEPPDAA